MASNFFQRYRRKRTPSASPTTSRAASPHVSSIPPTLSLFPCLPLELQLYVLSFLPVRDVVLTLSRASKHTLSLCDAHVRRRLTTLLAHDGCDADERPTPRASTTLVFEAGRPIDTINRRHVMFFSGFIEGGQTGGRLTSLASFTFVPRKGDIDVELLPSASGSTPTQIPDRPTFTDVARPMRSTHMPAVPISDGSSSAPPLRNPRYRFQLDPLDSFETWILSLTLQRRTGFHRRHPPTLDDDDETPLPPLSTRVFANSGTGRSSAGMDGSMRFGIMGAPGGATRSFVVGREGLEPVGLAERPMRWEKRVAEGLDRVFRSWFDEARTRRPSRRVLEFDGPSCLVEIQPRHHDGAVLASSYSSLSSLSARHAVWSAHRRSPSSSDGVDDDSSDESHGKNLPDGLVELTFSCTRVVLFAPRLLAAIEDVEDDVERARQRARAMGEPLTILAGSSGGSSWASTGENRFYRLG